MLAPAALTPSVLKTALGAKAEAVLGCDVAGTLLDAERDAAEAEVKAAAEAKANGAPEEAEASASVVEAASAASYHALSVSFSSVTAAISARELLEKLAAEVPSKPPAPVAVSYVRGTTELTDEQVAKITAEAAAAKATAAAAEARAADAMTAGEVAAAAAIAAATELAGGGSATEEELSKAMAGVSLTPPTEDQPNGAAVTDGVAEAGEEVA